MKQCHVTMSLLALWLAACSATPAALEEYRAIDATDLNVSARKCSQASGVARIQVSFDKAGRFADSKLVESSGCDDFDTAAVAQIRQWSFEPQSRHDDRQGRAALIVPVTFTRDGRDS